jgi:hypothetical protein
MKKYIISGIAVLAIAAVAAWNVGLSSQKNDGLSDVMLANVEALAQEITEGHCTQLCQYSEFTDCTLYHTVTHETKTCYYRRPR